MGGSGFALYYDNGYNTFADVHQVWQANKWYRLGVTWNVGGHIVARAYDSDGTSLLNTVSGTYNSGVTSGGIAFAGSVQFPDYSYGPVYFDTVAIDGRSNTDFYQVTLDSGSTFQAETATPGGSGSNEFPDPLVPQLVLYNAAGSEVASDQGSAPDGRNALLNYTVPAGQGGDYYVQVKSTTTPPTWTTGEYILTLTGLSPSAAIAPLSLPAWTANFPGYNQTIVAGGGVNALTFTSTGTLPPGLTLTSGGLLSGTPTTAGRYTFTVTATDSSGDLGSRTYSVVINPSINVITTAIVNGTLSVAYSQTFNASGGTGSLTFSTTGTLPPD
jgi:hypothetical protein